MKLTVSTSGRAINGVGGSSTILRARPFDPAVLVQAAAKVGIEILGAPGALPA